MGTEDIPLQLLTKQNYKRNIVLGNETGSFLDEDELKRTIT